MPPQGSAPGAIADCDEARVVHRPAASSKVTGGPMLRGRQAEYQAISLSREQPMCSAHRLHECQKCNVIIKERDVFSVT